MRFSGTQRECSQELGQFLLGATKEAYDALGGGQTKYRKLKPKLLQWYKAQRCSKIYRHKFEEIEMRPNEYLNLYCIRLERSVVKAYPNNEQDAEGIQNMSGVSLIGLIFIKWKQL